MIERLHTHGGVPAPDDRVTAPTGAPSMRFTGLGLLPGLLPGLLLGLLLAGGLPTAAGADDGVPRTPSPEDAKVYIIEPADGAEVRSPLTVRFGLSGMGVAPAGTQKAGTGHHHLIIDAPVPPAGAPIPADLKHRHFGGGQTEVTLDLSPGRHTLQLVLGDHAHVPHDPPVVSEVVTITVVE